MNTVYPPAAPGAPKISSRSNAGSAARIARFIGVRLLLAIITLWLLSVIVFAGGQLLPGDVGRAILGPLADARAVAALNHQLGVDRPLFTQYAGWISPLPARRYGSVVFVSRTGGPLHRRRAVELG
jgi:peptide/nickel transport system permease protein